MIKKIFVSLLSALCLSLCVFGVTAFAQEEMVLFDASDNTGLAIGLPEDPSDSENAAAELLGDYLEQITHIRPAIVNASSENGGDRVISLRVSESLKDAAKGSYELSADAEKGVLSIEAADSRGLFNGVYAFLRTACGVEIFSTDVKSVPETDLISVSLPFSLSYTPTLEYADTDWISPHDLEFSLANGLNGSYSPIEHLYGGKVNYIWFGHSLTTGIVPESELFESHPEYFALTEEGKREATQLCLSNPEVVQRAITDVRNQLEKSYDPDAALNIVSVTQDDNQDYCLCENCSALAEKYGGQSGLMLWFVNQIAENIEPDYPDVVIDTFAYQYTRKAPVGIVPRDNVCVRLCSIECCFAHALNDPACEENTEFMRDLTDWSKICSRLYIWDYTTNYSQTLGVFPDFGVLRENINALRENSVVGIYEEGAYYAGECNTEFADLRAYLLSCMMRDVMDEDDEKAATEGFLNAYYGAGGKFVGEILDIFTAHAGNEDGHLFIYASMEDSLHGMTKDDINKVDSLWDGAISAAKSENDDGSLARIERSRLCWRYYKACTRSGEFKSLIPELTNVKEMKKLISDLAAAGATRYNETNTMGDIKASPLFSPDMWSKMDSGIYAVSVICAAVTVLLALIAAVIALIKKRPLCAVLLAAFTAVCVCAGIKSAMLFIEWEDITTYFLTHVIMLLGVSGFAATAVWAAKGFAFKTKKGLPITFLSFFAAFIVCYEALVFLVNNIIFDGKESAFSITIICLLLMAAVAVSAALTAVCLLRRDKRPKGETGQIVG